ncbi:hypothetical protein OZ410_09160 [Robiginitalea sp. M366]|uniref:hypothetical protein n=1 Tax=Robiginitalea aestuariiviva TaxID=3036903 RepID=UPI00240DF975|nr:hypothetical protein [Robiginitalea aestuariiviva]MDG1572483.1 hypothetical protein [Robiginitalea aestuariiviva]
MKTKIFAFGLFMLLAASCQQPASELDTALLNCYNTAYQEAGFDLKAVIDDYEKTLVQAGVLKDDSGQSYLAVARKIAEDNSYRIAVAPFQQTDPWHKVDKNAGVAVLDCEYKQIAALQEKDARWQKVFGDPQRMGSAKDPGQMVQEMADALSEQDLDSYYFRLKMFQLFDMANAEWEQLSMAETDTWDK